MSLLHILLVILLLCILLPFFGVKIAWSGSIGAIILVIIIVLLLTGRF